MGNVFSWLIQPVSDDEVFPTNQESEEGTAPEQESEGPEVPRPLETLPEDILTSIPVVTKEASQLIVGLVAEASEELQSVALAATEALGIIPYPEVPEQHKPQGLAVDLQHTNVFGKDTMREYLPKKIYAEVVHAMEYGGAIGITTADVVANAMKEWSISKGATHYSHWFQPLTGITAEKHDSFITAPVDNKIILSSEFQGEKSPALIVDYSNNEMRYGDGKLSKLTPEAQAFFGSGDFIRNVEFKDLTK